MKNKTKFSLIIYVFIVFCFVSCISEAKSLKYMVLGTKIEQKQGRILYQGKDKVIILDNIYYLILKNGGRVYKFEVSVDKFNKIGNFGNVVRLRTWEQKDLILY